ncbi:MAG: ATP-binding protein [Frankiaceae bacterium]|nr:ATP-binding protein [Frankiaceae bacterium]
MQPGPLRLSPSDQAPSAARTHVARVLQAAALHHLVDTASLLVSELVTNAFRHGSGPITVDIEIAPDEITVLVGDAATQAPERNRPQRLHQTGGWGLNLVESLSAAWGCDPANPGPGKVVWFRLATA